MSTSDYGENLTPQQMRDLGDPDGADTYPDQDRSKCPSCGAVGRQSTVRLREDDWSYECNSYEHGDFVQSDACRHAVKDATIAELQQRVTEAEAKQSIDQQQCDAMTQDAGKLAVEVDQQAAEIRRLKKVEGALGQLVRWRADPANEVNAPAAAVLERLERWRQKYRYKREVVIECHCVSDMQWTATLLEMNERRETNVVARVSDLNSISAALKAALAEAEKGEG